MKPSLHKAVTAALAIGVLCAATVTASDYNGTVRVGYVYVDDEGNRGVHQPTYNLYEGVSLSLEDVGYRMDNGLRFYGNFENITLNNRNLRFGVSKSGLFGVNVRNNQYRRVYSFAGDKFTRRTNTFGDAWFQPHEYVRFFAGLGLTNKHGDMVELIDPLPSRPINPIDYSHTFYHTGVQVGHDGNFARFEYRGSEYTDDVDQVANDRHSKRFRFTAFGRLPGYRNLVVNFGAQRLENTVDRRHDTLKANTVWGGARFFYPGGWSARYSFIWDRARRTGDVVATDNISHALFADKVFAGMAGITAGYRYQMNDDVFDEVQTDGYHLSGWLRPVPVLTLRAGYGAEKEDVQAGRTLTGNRDYTRAWGSAKFKHRLGMVRVKVEDKSIENEDIGSSSDFSRVGADVYSKQVRYGEISASFAYLRGKYENTGGTFDFEEYVLSGDVLSAAVKNAQAGFGGMYMRSRLGVDVESFTVRFTGIYEFVPRHKFEIVYSAHNFDNFADPSLAYTEYYTANVVEVNLIKEF